MRKKGKEMRGDVKSLDVAQTGEGKGPPTKTPSDRQTDRQTDKGMDLLTDRGTDR